MIGTTIGKYRIIDKLGEGGMGSVYKAEDTALDRLVAIKALSRHLTDDEESQERFIREAKAASSLNHPGIATVFDLLEEEGESYIAMEYVEGKTIKDMVDGSHVSIKKAVDIILQTVEALGVAHGQGILHRDVKSANIMVTLEGRVKLMDFGLAQLEAHSQLTRSGTTLGTLAYSPPEQITGGIVDRRSEIFSLGIVLYELLTGKLPFKAGSSEAESIFAIINTEPDPVTTHREDVPENLQSILKRMMEKDPELRYANCSELINDLKAVRSEFDTSTVTITPHEPRKTISLPRRQALLVTGLVVIVLGAVAFLPGLLSSASAGIPRLAVLPFENLGSAEDEYFADGMADEIRSRLNRLETLEVISRNSVIQFKGQDFSTQQIRRDLGADFVLSGTIRWERSAGAGNRIRITPELTNASDGVQIWSASYEEEFAGIFRIQSEIADKVVRELNLALVQPGETTVEERLTESPEAYTAYLLGRRLKWSITAGYATRLVGYFTSAVELDPDFALAWAELAQAHAAAHHFGEDRTSERQEMARDAIEQALRLDPDHPDVLRANGYRYYWAHRDYDRALSELEHARQHLPNDVEILSGTSFILRRLGRFDEAIEIQENVINLDPLEPSAPWDLGTTLMLVRDYERAEDLFEKALALDPGFEWAWITLIQAGWLQGDLEAARANLDQFNRMGPMNPIRQGLALGQAFFERDTALLRTALDTYPLEGFNNPQAYLPRPLQEALYHLLIDDDDAGARALFEEARIHIEGKVRSQPDDPRFHSALGIALAGLGRREEALREGLLPVEELYPVSMDAYEGINYVQHLATIYLLLGDYDMALETLEFLLSRPGGFSSQFAEIDPLWDPLRDDPRFREIIDRYR